MSRIIEFVGNHPILAAMTLLIVGMLAFYEYQRAFSGVKILSTMEATRLQNDEAAIFLDVREDSEHKLGHIKDSLHIPSSAFAKRIVELEKFKDKPIIVYCANGPRASSVASKLAKNDFQSVYTLHGGAVGWEKASLPLVSG